MSSEDLEAKVTVMFSPITRQSHDLCHPLPFLCGSVGCEPAPALSGLMGADSGTPGERNLIGQAAVTTVMLKIMDSPW